MPTNQGASMADRATELIEKVLLLNRLDPLDEEDKPRIKELRDVFHTEVNQFGASYPDARKQLLILINSVYSEIEAYEDGEQSVVRMRGNIRRSAARFREFVNKLAINAPDLNTPAGQDAQEEHDRNVLQKNSEAEAKLRAGILGTGIYFNYAPVLPMASFDREKLKRLGFNVDTLSGYSVLNRQRVFGVSYDYLLRVLLNNEELIEKAPDLAKKIKRLKNVEKVDEAIAKYVNAAFSEIVETFQKRNPGYEQVGDHCSWNEARWVWFMPRRELALLRTAAWNESSFRLTRWNFAFRSTTRALPSIQKRG